MVIEEENVQIFQILLKEDVRFKIYVRIISLQKIKIII